MSPMVVPASNQTVAHARYSNVTRVVGASVEGAATRRGSRIRVLIAEGSIVIAPRSWARVARRSNIHQTAPLAPRLLSRRLQDWTVKRGLSIYRALILDSSVDEGSLFDVSRHLAWGGAPPGRRVAPTRGGCCETRPPQRPARRVPVRRESSRARWNHRSKAA